MAIYNNYQCTDIHGSGHPEAPVLLHPPDTPVSRHYLGSLATHTSARNQQRVSEKGCAQDKLSLRNEKDKGKECCG